MISLGARPAQLDDVIDRGGQYHPAGALACLALAVVARTNALAVQHANIAAFTLKHI